MGVPIIPPEDSYGCCEPELDVWCHAANIYLWPPGNICRPEAWEIWMMYCSRFFSYDVYAYPGCSGYCIYELTAITFCTNDEYTLTMRGPAEFIGISNNPDYTFTGYHIAYEQGFFPAGGLFCEEHRLADNTAWVGIRDGTGNVRILFKRDLAIQ